MKKHLIFLLVILAGKLSLAQTAATNTGVLYISTGSDILYSGGDFTNNSGSSLTNNGQLHIKGNLNNGQSSMAIGTGTLYLVGSSAQSLNGTQPFKTYNLNTNNSSGITLNNNLSVSGTHTFNAGLITTSATPNYLVYEAGSSYTGDGDTKHVNGWVKKFGSTNFTFPVGSALYERGIQLKNLTTSSEFNALYLPFTPNSTSRVIPVYNVDDLEYWTVNKISGGSAIVALNWDYSKVYFPNWILSDILVTGWNGTAWVDNGGVGTATGNVMTTGGIASATVSSFNLFTFGSQSYILSLSLLNFNAARQDNYTQISWTTDKESNTDHFVVERSDDGNSFYSISQQVAHNSGNLEQYSAKDYGLISHVAYYRLRIVSTDGQSKLSKTVVVTVNNDAQITLLVNPVHEQIMLLANPTLSGTFKYTVTAMDGKLMQQGKLGIQNGGQYQVYLQNGLAAGIYVLLLSDGKSNFSFRIEVE